MEATMMAFVGSRQIWFVQSFRHASAGNESFLMQPSTLLPSSQVSPASTTPSPQDVQLLRHIPKSEVIDPGGSHVSPGSTMPSPQDVMQPSGHVVPTTSL